MANYTFTANDISAIAAAGVTALFKGATLKAGDVYGAGIQDTLKFTCNAGKKFTTNSGVVSVNFLGSDGTRVNGTLSSGDTVADFSGSLPSGSKPWAPPTYSFNIATVAATTPIFYTFVEADITKANNYHFSIFKNGVAVGAGTNVVQGDVVKLVAATGYKFKLNSAGTIASNVNFYGSLDNFLFAPIDSSAKEVSITIPDWNKLNIIEFYADDKTTIIDNIPVTLEWVNHPSTGQSNTNINFSWTGGDTSTVNYDLVVYKSDGTTIADEQTIPVAAKSANINEVAGTYTVKVYDKGGRTDATANVISQQIVISDAPKPTRFTFTADHVAKLTNSHVNMTINGSPVVAGSTIVDGDSLVAKAISGYEFYKDPLASIYLQRIGNRYPFTLSSDNKTATYTVGAINYDVFDVATKLPTPATKAGNNVYVIDNQKLSDITAQRFVLTGTDVLLDYGDYILSVLELPFAIDPALIAGTENVMLGDKDTHVVANKLSVDVITVDMGSITIPETFNNLLDFDNTTAILHLPFAPSVNIDIEYVVGQTISVEYQIDCYTGKATINIKSTKIGNNVLDTHSVSLGINIPYAKNSGGDIVNSNIKIGGNNHITNPFIEIVRSDAKLINGMFTIPIADEQLLNTQTGFIQVENIDLNSNAIKSEKDDLINILNSGVIIK